LSDYRALPHGPIQEVFRDIFFVRGAVTLPIRLPVRMSRSMTILRDGDELTLVNSIRLSKEGLGRLEALGRIVRVIRIGGFHGRDDGFYRERYGARVLAIEGQAYTREIRSDESNLSFMEPDEWLDSSTPLSIADARLFVFGGTPPEAILVLEREGGILVTADSLQNTAGPDEFVNFLGRQMMKRIGFFKAHGLGPGWLRSAEPPAADVAGILELSFEHVLPGHGEPVIGDAREKYRPAIEAFGAVSHLI